MSQPEAQPARSSLTRREFLRLVWCAAAAFVAWVASGCGKLPGDGVFVAGPGGTLIGEASSVVDVGRPDVVTDSLPSEADVMPGWEAWSTELTYLGREEETADTAKVPGGIRVNGELVPGDQRGLEVVETPEPPPVPTPDRQGVCGGDLGVVTTESLMNWLRDHVFNVAERLKAPGSEPVRIDLPDGKDVMVPNIDHPNVFLDPGRVGATVARIGEMIENLPAGVLKDGVDAGTIFTEIFKQMVFVKDGEIDDWVREMIAHQIDDLDKREDKRPAAMMFTTDKKATAWRTLAGLERASDLKSGGRMFLEALKQARAKYGEDIMPKREMNYWIFKADGVDYVLPVHKDGVNEYVIKVIVGSGHRDTGGIRDVRIITDKIESGHEMKIILERMARIVAAKCGRGSSEAFIVTVAAAVATSTVARATALALVLFPTGTALNFSIGKMAPTWRELDFNELLADQAQLGQLLHALNMKWETVAGILGRPGLAWTKHYVPFYGEDRVVSWG